MSALMLTRSETLIVGCSMMRKYSMCLTHESQKLHSFVRSTYGPNRLTLHSAKYWVSAADRRSLESRHGIPPVWHLVMSTSRSERTRTLLGEVGIESTNCEHKPQLNHVVQLHESTQATSHLTECGEVGWRGGTRGMYMAMRPPYTRLPSGLNERTATIRCAFTRPHTPPSVHKAGRAMGLELFPPSAQAFRGGSMRATRWGEG